MSPVSSPARACVTSGPQHARVWEIHRGRTRQKLVCIARLTLAVGAAADGRRTRGGDVTSWRRRCTQGLSRMPCSAVAVPPGVHTDGHLLSRFNSFEIACIRSASRIRRHGVVYRGGRWSVRRSSREHAFASPGWPGPGCRSWRRCASRFHIAKKWTNRFALYARHGGRAPELESAEAISSPPGWAQCWRTCTESARARFRGARYVIRATIRRAPCLPRRCCRRNVIAMRDRRLDAA